MANLRTNQEEIIGSLIPDVYVDTVTLETSGDIIKHRNPHIDFAGEEGRRDPVTGEVLEPVGPPEDEGTLTVLVNMLLKDKVETGFISSWFNQQGFNKFVKIIVAVSTNSAVSNLLIRAETDKSFARLFFGAGIAHRHGNTLVAAVARQLENDPRFKDLSRGQTYEVVEASLKDVSLSAVPQLGPDDEPRAVFEIQEDEDGGQVQNIGVKARFSIEGTTNPEHLTIFAFSYLDLSALQEEIPDLDFNPDGYNSTGLSFATGKLTIQSVVRDSQIVKNASIFRDERGRVWPGRVHQMAPGQFMTGQSHDSNRNQRMLTRSIIPNTTVQDFRNVKNVEKNITDLSFFKSRIIPSLSRIFRERVEKNLNDENKSSYFSDLFLARGLKEQANMAFSIDVGKFIRERTKYPALLEADPSLLFTHYKILSLSVGRRRVQKPAKFKDSVVGYNVDGLSLILFDKEKPVELVVTSQDSRLGLSSIIGEQTGNTIREIDLDTGGGVRSFSVSDHEISKATDGFYQYGIELEIQDKLKEFLKAEIVKLMMNRALFIEYYNESSEPTGKFKKSSNSAGNPHIIVPSPRPDVGTPELKENYNPYTNRFTRKFIEKMERKYSEVPADSPWNKIIENISVLLDLFSSQSREASSLKNTEFKKNLWTLSSPQTGSPDGILAILEMVDNTVSRISKLIGENGSVTTDTSAGSTSRGSFSSSSSSGAPAPKKDTYKIMYWFTNSVFDTNQLKETGFHYLLNRDEEIREISGNDGLAGLRSLSINQFRSRISNEVLSFFREANAPISTQEVNNYELMTLLADTATSDYSFLSPARVRVKNGKTYSGFQEMSLPISTAVTISEILNINSPPNSPKRIPSPRADTSEHENVFDTHSKTIRDNLIEVLADRNCTIEVPLITAPLPHLRAAPIAAPSQRSLPSIGGVSSPLDRIDTLDSVNNSISEFLGDSSSILSGMREERENNIDIHTTRDNDTFNPGLMFLKMMLTTILEKEGLPKTTTTSLIRQPPARRDIQAFSLFNEDNVIEKIHQGNRFRRGKRYEEFVPGLPIQIKSLILGSHPTGGELVRRIMGNLFEGDNPLVDPLTAISVFMRFMSLVRIELFTGYEYVTQEVSSPSQSTGASDRRNENSGTTTKREFQLKEPTWTLLSRRLFNQRKDLGVEMLCRIRPYSSEEMGVYAIRAAQLPIYDEYFTIRPHDLRNIPLTPSVPPSNLPNLEVSYRDVSREFISTDPRILEDLELEEVGPAVSELSTLGGNNNVQS